MRHFVPILVSASVLAACASLLSVDDVTYRSANDGTDASVEVGVPDAQDGAGASSLYAAAVLEDRPLRYFRLGERGAIPAVDSSVNGAAGAYVGGVVQGIPGALSGDPDTAVRFDGSDDEYVDLPGVDFPGKASFTLEAWVRPEAPIDGVFNILVGRQDLGWGLFIQSEELKFARTDLGSSYEGPPWFNAGGLHDRFSHIVGTFDGTAMHLYIDGVDVGESGAVLEIPPSGEHPHLGRHFPGSLDEVAIYDHALSPDRVLAHYERGVGK